MHGAGPQISREMERAGIPVEFVDGRRVTSAAAIEIVRASFARRQRRALRGDRRRAPSRCSGDEIGLEADAGAGARPRRRPAPLRRRRRSSPRSSAGRVPVVAPLGGRPAQRQRRRGRRGARARARRRPAALPHRRRRADPRRRGRRRDRRRGRRGAARAAARSQGGIIPKLGAAVDRRARRRPASIGRTAVAA